LVVNYFTGGLPFSALLCIFAGLFLVMPGLIHFDFKDFSLIKKEKKLTALNILLNVIVIPMILIISGIIFFPHNSEIRYALAMLGILPGG
jgi:ACR3 family arsenite efflux pump ArsB